MTVSNPLLKKLIGASTTKRASLIQESKYLNEKDMITTEIPALNIAFSGDLDGGLVPGFTMIAGPSKHFKTLMMLLAMKAYLDKYPDAVAYFEDSEFGTPISYFESIGIDMTRVVHNSVTNIEELKHDLSAVLEAIERGDRVFIGIDSIGNLASKKEVEDALDGRSVADMTRAKQLKSLFRIITPHLTIKDIPLIAINHTYKEIGLYPKDIVGGGTGSYYSADNIWIIGRQQDKKPGEDLKGWNFIINVEKSRFVREKSKISIMVGFDKGLYKWSGLFDLAKDGNFIVAGKKGWYSAVNSKTGEVEEKVYREKDLGPVFEKLIKNKEFKQYVRDTYQLGAKELISEETVSDDEDDA